MILLDITQHYDGHVSVKSLRELEKLYIKLDKSTLDINFLNHVKKFGAIPKFLYLNLPHTNNNDQMLRRFVEDYFEVHYGQETKKKEASKTIWIIMV